MEPETDVMECVWCRKLLSLLPPDEALKTVRTLRKRLAEEALEKKREEEPEKKLKEETFLTKLEGEFDKLLKENVETQPEEGQEEGQDTQPWS